MLGLMSCFVNMIRRKMKKQSQLGWEQQTTRVVGRKKAGRSGITTYAVGAAWAEKEHLHLADKLALCTFPLSVCCPLSSPFLTA